VAAVAAQQATLDANTQEAYHNAAAAAQQAKLGVSGPSQSLRSKMPKTKAQLQAAVDGPPPTISAAGSHPQGLSGATAVRKATAVERLASKNVMDPAKGDHLSAAVQRGLMRVGHKFRIELRPDGTVVHRYGKDVPEELREVTIKAARRHAVGSNGGVQAP
jgi:hypothetical protein